jgi:hypothetical protein
MKPAKTLIILICSLGLLLPGIANAQHDCPNPVATTCGTVNLGDLTGGSDLNDAYTCPGGDVTSFTGEENFWLLTLPEELDVEITVYPTDWDAGLFILPESGGNCGTPATICQDGPYIGEAETIVTTLSAGTYYIAVDAWQGDAGEGVGPYELEILCGPLSTCVDADGDGFAAIDPVDCPEGYGTECCDDGTEDSPGCDADTAPVIFPGSADFCGDGIDHDCDGMDCCEDTDGDGYAAASCGGRDCCDAGDESHPGCSTETAADMNPAAAEVCGNAIDENCDWLYDETCPPCASDYDLSCPNAADSIADTSTGSSNLEGFCGYGGYTSYENIFAVTLAADGLIEFIATYAPYSTGGYVFDAFVMTGAGAAGTCDPMSCYALSGSGGTGTEHLFFAGYQDQEYFIAVDERTGATGAFDYTMTCLEPEFCVVDEVVTTCDTTLSGDTTGQDNNINAYPYRGGSFRRIGLEYVYAFTLDTDATVEFSLSWDTALGIDMGLWILEDDGSDTCDPYGVVAGADLIDEPPPEEITLRVAAGVTYYLVVDSYDETNFGPFTIDIECKCTEGLIWCGDRECVDPQADPIHCGGCGNYCGAQVCDQGVCADNCSGGLSECSGWCVNTDTSMFHCGACDNSCMVANADTSCVTGSCVLDVCHAGFDDCNITFADGCEADLSTPETCGTCENVCDAGDSCCTGVCEDLQTDVDNCGTCGTVCDLANVDTHECVAGSCTIAACDTDFLDCDTTDANGCEVDSATDEFNCGECTNVCALDNVTDNGCAAGECTIVTCADGYLDCDTAASTGCESDVTTDVDNCGACDNACAAGAECIDSDCCTDADGDTHYDPTDCDAGDDCDDDDDSVYPGADEVCDNVDNDCDNSVDETFDGDNDNYTSCGGDCDDSNNAINPGAEDVCGNGIDEDCDGQDLECTCRDDDNDGHDAESCGGTDCDDTDDTVYPGADELCGDDTDNDCDDAIDEDCEGDDDGGCGCAAAGGSPISSGLLVLLLVLGMAWLPVRRR